MFRKVQAIAGLSKGEHRREHVFARETTIVGTVDCHRERAAAALFESLEPRIVLSSAVGAVGVGLIFDTTAGFSAYVEEGTWNADRSFTAQRFVASDAGPVLQGDSNLIDLIPQAEGVLKPIETTPQYDSVFATRFDQVGGYAAGWFGGQMADGSGAQLSTIVQRPASATLADLNGTWSIQLLQVVGTKVYTRNGTLSIGGDSVFFSILDRDSGDPILAEGGVITDVSADGRFTYQTGNGDTGFLYLSADGSTISLADLDTGDGDFSVGVAVKTGASFTEADLAGTYRAAIVADGPATAAFFGEPALFANITFNADATFSLAPLDTPTGQPDTGTWTLFGGTITASFDTFSNIKMEFRVADNGTTLVPIRLRDFDAGVAEQFIGMVTRVQTDVVPSATTLGVGIFDSNGQALVFDLRADDIWTVVDLDRYTLGDVLGNNPADIQAFETSSGELFAAVTTDTGLFVAQRDALGFWTSVNLTSSITDAVDIVSPITVFTDLNGVSYIAGLTGDGDVVTYDFDPNSTSGSGWSFDNISQTQLAPKSIATPQFVGSVISYVTSWNGLNIAGLDANGDIQAVWSGNGGKDWFANNLSEITGAPKIASGLTAYLTSWGGINIIGLDDAGSVLATWWVPAFGPTWRVDDLTAIAGGPALFGSSLTSFVAPWGGLNIAGLDAQGDVVAYWWSPSLDKQGKTWQVANLTADIAPGEPRPTEQLSSQTNTSHQGEMNILGTDATTGDLLRVFFRVDTQLWALENVTSLASYA